MSPTVLSSLLSPLFNPLFGPKCSSIWLNDYNFFDNECFSIFILKCLGYLIILGSVGVKIPQILKLIQNRSSSGVSPSMYLLENIGYSISCCYNYRNNYPFSSYGENIFLLIQGILLVFLVYKYNNSINIQFYLIILFFIFFLIFIFFYSSIYILSSLQALSIPIFTLSKIPQIITNFNNSSTGQLAFITLFLNFVGAAVRVLTTLKESGDFLLLCGITIATTLNGILLAQFIIYRNNTKASGKNNKKNENNNNNENSSKNDNTNTGLNQRKPRSKKAE